jgi:type II secretory pathway component PulF
MMLLVVSFLSFLLIVFSWEFVLYTSTHIFRQKLNSFLFSLPFINGRVADHKIKRLVCFVGQQIKHNPLISE